MPRHAATAATCADAGHAAATLSVQAGRLAGPAAAPGLLSEQLYPLLASGAIVTLSVERLGKPGFAIARLERILALLAAAAADAGASPDSLELDVSAAFASPATLRRVTDRLLGRCNLWLRIPRAWFASPVSARQRAARQRYWSELAALSDARVTPRLSADVIAASPLLVSESGSAILPGSGLEVPPGSAWINHDLDIRRYCRGGLDIDYESFGEALGRALANADGEHEIMEWPTPSMRHDAWLNRRVAIGVTGLGELVAGSGRDPAAITVRDTLHELIEFAARTLLEESRSGATGAVPAIAHSDPTRGLPSGTLRDDWRSRWLRAVGDHSVRHRNLLALSPWSLIPASRSCDSGYLELLPLLRHAHAIAMRPPAGLQPRGAAQLACLYARLDAALQQRAAAHQIAQQI